MDTISVKGAAVEMTEGLGEISAEAFVRSGWSAKFRGVLITRLGVDGGTYSIVALPESMDDMEWQPVTFAANVTKVRILVPNSVRIMNRAGQTAEIERRPLKPSDLGWEA